MPLAKLIDIGELREQLDHIRSLKLTRGESTWLRGNTFYGKRQMFSPDFMTWLEGFRFPAYHLERQGDQYELIFEGSWIETTMWEIPALAVIMELRSRAVLRGLGKFELQVLYARAMTRVWRRSSACAASNGSASPTSAPAGGTASCGRTGACRRCRRGLAAHSSAPPTA